MQVYKLTEFQGDKADYPYVATALNWEEVSHPEDGTPVLRVRYSVMRAESQGTSFFAYPAYRQVGDTLEFDDRGCTEMNGVACKRRFEPLTLDNFRTMNHVVGKDFLLTGVDTSEALKEYFLDLMLPSSMRP